MIMKKVMFGSLKGAAALRSTSDVNLAVGWGLGSLGMIAPLTNARRADIRMGLRMSSDLQ
jgi:hypothetical protein